MLGEDGQIGKNARSVDIAGLPGVEVESDQAQQNRGTAHFLKRHRGGGDVGDGLGETDSESLADGDTGLAGSRHAGVRNDRRRTRKRLIVSGARVDGQKAFLSKECVSKGVDGANHGVVSASVAGGEADFEKERVDASEVDRDVVDVEAGQIGGFGERNPYRKLLSYDGQAVFDLDFLTALHPEELDVDVTGWLWSRRERKVKDDVPCLVVAVQL